VVVVWLVCRHLAAVVWSTYTTVVYTTVVSIVDLWSIHDGCVRNIKHAPIPVDKDIGLD